MFNIDTDINNASGTIKAVLITALKSAGYTNGQAVLTGYKSINDSDKCGIDESLTAETLDSIQWTVSLLHKSCIPAMITKQPAFIGAMPERKPSIFEIYRGKTGKGFKGYYAPAESRYNAYSHKNEYYCTISNGTESHTVRSEYVREI